MLHKKILFSPPQLLFYFLHMFPQFFRSLDFSILVLTLANLVALYISNLFYSLLITSFLFTSTFFWVGWGITLITLIKRELLIFEIFIWGLWMKPWESRCFDLDLVPFCDSYTLSKRTSSTFACFQLVTWYLLFSCVCVWVKGEGDSKFCFSISSLFIRKHLRQCTFIAHYNYYVVLLKF